jgi:hypothetical protein
MGGKLQLVIESVNTTARRQNGAHTIAYLGPPPSDGILPPYNKLFDNRLCKHLRVRAEIAKESNPLTGRKPELI